MRIIRYLKNRHSRLCEMSKSGGKNLCWLIKDFLKFRNNRLISFEEYENYKLYSRNNEFRINFLSYRLAEYYWEVLNPRTYACLARDKFIGHCLLDSVGIPTAKLIAYYNKESAVSSTLIGKDYEDIINLLKSSSVQSFVIKPAKDSAHGTGVIVCRRLIEKKGEYFIRKFDGSEISLKKLLGDVPLIFEETIIQIDQLRNLNESSLNTIRIMTALYPDSTVNVFAAFIKIGRHGSDIDNAGSGGNIDCGVNVETGKLYNAEQFDSWSNIKKIQFHPDSNAELNGMKIKNWHSIIAKLKYYQGLIPQLKIIGWDVAITDGGPVIIEINNWWDTTGQEFIDMGWAGEVENCYNAWVKYYGK